MNGKQDTTSNRSKQKYIEKGLLCGPQKSDIFSTTGSPRLQNLH